MKTDTTNTGATTGPVEMLTAIARVAMLFTCALALSACDESGGSNSCSRDEDCPRGTICEDDSCTEVPCGSIGECPGSGRTCLADLRTCSPQECAAVNQSCEAAEVCVESGPFRSSCLGPDALGCTVDAECGGFGEGFRCCGNICSDMCPDVDAIPTGDMSPTDAGPTPDGDPPGDGGVEDQGPLDPDMAPPMGGELCAACGRNEDCEALGGGAQCTPIGNSGSFCTSACDGPDDCPAGYNCLDAVGQCIPGNYNCETCPATPCDAGTVCDVASGECVPPRQVCEGCTGDDCAPGLTCAQAGGAAVCLAECPDGNCPAGYACDGGLCEPEGGACDACNGQCAPPTGVCLQDDGRCVECDAANPCLEEGQVCDLGSNTCQAEGAGCACVQDRDCEPCLGLPICFRGACVACLEEADCPPRFTCSDNNQCVRAPCAGVACQQGAQCDPQSGQCVNGMGGPGCAGPQDCAVPDAMSCNQETGQCFYNDGSCDPPGGDGVCPPGSNCTVNPLLMTSTCTCKKVDPIGMPFGPDLVPCHPGGVCFHGEFPPGSGMAAEEGFCAQFGM